ncbi:DNA repair protein RecN [Flavobacterium agricola]|uniref:DNA repair protein RecN n=1 Tax=Flavobacterium agricola TaxID=2870839 RepID=A0ABY6M3R8_9FLAO|nr:DNA repair protein RecN [Flavobacterium agricola]UYW02155.1 DNA repair protein RecN [Flavobacterium agricola]
MLNHLYISNFALIESLEMEFSKGMSIITGETGAGKSILLGALGLVLGKRADLSSLKNKDEKCIIEAHFAIKNYNLQAVFEANEIDYDDLTIIRREILPSGKSRAFVNDSPINLSVLQNLSQYLLDIHSQHQTSELAEDSFQLEMIDAVANNHKLLAQYQMLLKQYKKAKKEYNQLTSDKADLIKEYDYNSFLLNELIELDLKSINQEELEKQLEVLANIETLQEHLDKGLAILTEEQYGIVANLKELKASIGKASAITSEYNELLERITSVLIEVDDITHEVEIKTENLVHDPETLFQINQKLQALYALQKKHGVLSVYELTEIQTELENKVISVDEFDAKLAALQTEIEKLTNDLQQIANQLTQKRAEAAPLLISKILEILAQLGMKNARFEYENVIAKDFLPTGRDQIQLLLSANTGTNFGPIKKVASGGEMSRIMLAIKAIMSKYSKLPTIIFDEIDTGVSGEIANKMAEIMYDMSSTMQVFVITHLPQVASKGDYHFKVSKSVVNGTTVSVLNLLNDEERILQIAEMISGDNYSESAINHAKELLRLL